MKQGQPVSDDLAAFKWMIEELRVSLFCAGIEDTVSGVGEAVGEGVGYTEQNVIWSYKFKMFNSEDIIKRHICDQLTNSNVEGFFVGFDYDTENPLIKSYRWEPLVDIIFVCFM